ncbi:phosphatidylserine decarboxylase [Clostridium tetanomorphum]|nr:phosphatidylserine decarboxylase [Clostridium tetanomorphum]
MIKFYNRKTKKYEIEKVAGSMYLKWTYSSPVGMRLLELIVKKKLFSKLYGFFCNTKISKKKIPSFISDFGIDISICEKN